MAAWYSTSNSTSTTTATTANCIWFTSSTGTTTNWTNSTASTTYSDNWHHYAVVDGTVWVDGQVDDYQSTPVQFTPFVRVSETLEERRVRRRRELAEKRLRLNSKQRAQRLLLNHLTDEQRKSVEEKGWFVVVGGKSGTRYRIKAANDNLAGNIQVLNGETV